MGKRHEQTLLQRTHPDGQSTHEKMLNITHHQGNTNQNHNEIPPHLSEWLTRTTQETTDVDEDAKKGNSLTLLVGMQTGAATLENSMEFPQKVKNRTTL